MCIPSLRKLKEVNGRKIITIGEQCHSSMLFASWLFWEVHDMVTVEKPKPNQFTAASCSFRTWLQLDGGMMWARGKCCNLLWGSKKNIESEEQLGTRLMCRMEQAKSARKRSRVKASKQRPAMENTGRPV